MSSGLNPDPQDYSDSVRATLLTALSGMTAAQLVELRTTARRLEHLPFPVMVKALIERSPEGDAFVGQEPVDDVSTHGQPVLADNARASRRSQFMDELFAQIEQALAAKIDSE